MIVLNFQEIIFITVGVWEAGSEHYPQRKGVEGREWRDGEREAQAAAARGARRLRAAAKCFAALGDAHAHSLAGALARGALPCKVSTAITRQDFPAPLRCCNLELWQRG